MKNKILTLALVILCCLSLSVSAQSTPVTATGGTVVIDAELDGIEDGTPVLIVVMPEITDIVTNEDITMSKLPTSKVASEIISSLKGSELAVEYIDVCLAGEDGKINLTCKMKPSLTTGDCHVYAKAYGKADWEKVGEFQHVGQDDVDNLLLTFNGASSGFKTAIENDIKGKKLLEKSSANTHFYENLMGKTPDFTGEFCEVLTEKKPEEGFDILSLVSAFNEACAWIELRCEEDTLAVLTKYNDKYWTIPFESEDFTDLEDEEKEKILLSVKSEKTSDKEKLAEVFEKELVLALFRSLDTREDLEELISEENKFSSYFEEVRTILEDADINDYQKLNVLNDVLDENTTIEDFEEICDLFEEGIDSLESSKGGGSSGGGGGGKAVGSKSSVSGGANISSPKKSEVSKAQTIPFNDVKEDNWAYGYIKRLYDEKVINGTSETEFSPQNAIARQDFVKILVGALKIELSLTDSSFSDLSVGCYYEPYIMAAVENGLISGLGDESFGMGKNITRQDAAVIVSRVLKEEAEDKEVSFKDEEEISDYAKDGVIKSAKMGIFSGDNEGKFNPKESLTRAEACAILSRLADKVKEGAK